MTDKPALPNTCEPASDEAYRFEWRANGGGIHGPNVETVAMPEADYLRFRRTIDAIVERAVNEIAQIRALLGVPDDHDLMTHVRSLVGQWHATGDAQPKPAPAGMVPTVCDGKEQEAFEAWATAEKYDMQTHPLHWLFLDGETHAARKGWAAALHYVSNTIAAAPTPPPPTLNEAFDQVGAAMHREVCGDAAQVAHADDLAVDKFAAAMKEKLAAARAKGRGGWDDPEDLEQYLSNLLRAHVEKGDPRDVANFCCFLWNRGEAICAAPAVVVDEEVATNAWRKAHYAFQVTGLEAGSGKGDAEKAAVSALAAALKGDAAPSSLDAVGLPTKLGLHLLVKGVTLRD